MIGSAISRSTKRTNFWLRIGNVINQSYKKKEGKECCRISDGISRLTVRLDAILEPNFQCGSPLSSRVCAHIPPSFLHLPICATHKQLDGYWCRSYIGWPGRLHTVWVRFPCLADKTSHHTLWALAWVCHRDGRGSSASA